MWRIAFLVTAALINTGALSTETKYSRTRENFFDPVLSATSYSGHMKENEHFVTVEPRLYATDADPSNSINGKICGYELSLHKHDDPTDGNTESIPFTIDIVNEQPVLKLKSNVNALDCESKQAYRMYVRAYDCGLTDKRRYSERSSLIITVDDINEYAPVFTHDHYLFKLHENQTCDASTCRVEATDDDCANQDHGVCGYEITTPNVPFSIDSHGIISTTATLNTNQYEFDVIAIDCYPSNDNSRKTSQPARVTVKIMKSCKPIITDKTPSSLVIQSDKINLFGTVNVNTCDETCHVQDIVGTIELDTNGLDSGCNSEQCSATDREYVLLAKDNKPDEIPQLKITTFNGYDKAFIVNQSEFSGHLSNEFTIRIWMKHANDNKKSNEKEHVFCKSDSKLKNRHHAALLIQNNFLKLLLRKGPVTTNDNRKYATEWIWKLDEINDNQWHLYKFVVNYPNKIDLYVDGNLIITSNDNFRVVEDHPLTLIQGTGDTVFTLGACWHARVSNLVQYFRGQLSGFTIEQKEELQRSSNCIRDCRQYIDIPDIKSEANLEFISNTNRSTWIVRTDTTESYERLLKHLVYRNTFEPIGPHGQRRVTVRTRVQCLGEANPYNLPTFTRYISIEEPQLPVKIELKGDTNYNAKESAVLRGIYLFKNLLIFTNAIKKSQGDISDCIIKAVPLLSKTEKLIIPHVTNLETIATKEGVMFSGVESIDFYQHLLRQITYMSEKPVPYGDRTFLLSCTGVQDQIVSNEIRIRVRIEKHMAPSAPIAAIVSNKLVVDNDQMRDNTMDVNDGIYRTKRNMSGWSLAAVLFVSIGLAGVLVMYLIVRVRSNNRQNNPITNTGDDIHSQMEWEDDIGLNITVNPLDETKKPVQSTHIHDIEKNMDEYAGSSSEEEDDNGNNNNNQYSSEDDNDDENNRVHSNKRDHQLEWDDAAIEYGPKKV